jgi:hypothetical protein
LKELEPISKEKIHNETKVARQPSLQYFSGTWYRTHRPALHSINYEIGKHIRNTWAVLKCDAGEDSRKSGGPIV